MSLRARPKTSGSTYGGTNDAPILAFPWPEHIHVSISDARPVEEGDVIGVDSEGNVHHVRMLWEAK